MLLSLNPLPPPPSPQDGYTALMMAIGQGHVAVVQALLEAGADIDIQGNVSV